MFKSKRKWAWERQKSIRNCWNIEEVKLLYRKKVNVVQPSNVLDADSPKERVEKWLCKHQKADFVKTPKNVLKVQIPIGLFNSFR